MNTMFLEVIESIRCILLAPLIVDKNNKSNLGCMLISSKQHKSCSKKAKQKNQDSLYRSLFVSSLAWHLFHFGKLMTDLDLHPCLFVI